MSIFAVLYYAVNSVIGLLMSIAAQLTWQTVASVSVGLIVQIIGVISYEAISSRYILHSRHS